MTEQFFKIGFDFVYPVGAVVIHHDIAHRIDKKDVVVV